MSELSDIPPGQEKVDLRLCGLMLFVLGLVLMAAFIGWPIYQAHQAAGEIVLQSKLIAIGVITTLIGLNGMIFGRRFFEWIPSRANDKISPMMLLVLAVNVAIMMYVQKQLEGYLESLGYLFKR